MDCNDYAFDKTVSIREQMQHLSGDEFIALDAIRQRGVILSSQGIVSNSTLFELHCRDWLIRAEFVDDDVAYKAVPDIMLEFKQYLREVDHGGHS